MHAGGGFVSSAGPGCRAQACAGNFICVFTSPPPDTSFMYIISTIPCLQLEVDRGEIPECLQRREEEEVALSSPALALPSPALALPSPWTLALPPPSHAKCDCAGRVGRRALGRRAVQIILSPGQLGRTLGQSFVWERSDSVDWLVDWLVG